MQLGWIVNRLRSMSAPEIAHRLRERFRMERNRRWKRGWADWAAMPLHPLPGLTARLDAADDAGRALIAAAAQETLAGRFAALGKSWPERPADALFPASLWRLDPITGGAWPGPERYTFDIGFRHDGTRGDVKYVWEINRLQFLPPLAAEVRMTGNPAALAAIVAAIDSWADANPPFKGLGWASGIEVALRAISLAVTATLLGDALPPPTAARISAILTASTYWLEQFPSRFSSANNHRIAELAGLYVIATALGTETIPAATELASEIELQILPDGVGAEQSPTYAAFTAEMALLCAVIGKAAGRPFPQTMVTRLARFAAFVVALDGGALLSPGDDDEGRVFATGPEPDYAASVAAAITAQMVSAGPPLPPDFRAVLFGRPHQPATAKQGLTTLANGGLSVWHGALAGRRARLGFDHGPLGYLAIAAHGHADALSITVALDGKPVLIDPGTYLYGSGGVWRSWFRGTAAHNTLNIEGLDQSRITGAFNWGEKAVTQLESAAGAWPLLASHDGYLKRFAVRHQRALRIEADALVIRDALTGGEPHAAELAFQLAPGLEAEIDGATATVTDAGKPLLRFTFAAAGRLTAQAGGEAPGHGGWAAPHFGEKLPATRLSWRGTVGPDGVETTLTILPTALDTPPAQT